MSVNNAGVASHLHPIASYEVGDHPLPARRSEIWRFSPLNELRPLTEDGHPYDGLGWRGELPAGVTMTELSRDEAIARGVGQPVDRIAALALARGRGARLDIPAGAVLEHPVVLDAEGARAPSQIAYGHTLITIGAQNAEGGRPPSPPAQVTYGHTLITVGAHARAIIVLRYGGLAVLGELLNVEIGEGAEVTIVSLQNWDEGAVHAGQHSFLIGRNATVKTVTATLGGDAVRLMETTSFDGPGGSIDQFGLYFADTGQHLEHRLFVDHNAPHTTSRVDYRGALQGAGAWTAWVGDVLIRKVAEDIDTYESNKNLMLTDGCRADSVPNLEIETGQIRGAGHSSTTGRFDDEQLFYLRSRGIPEDEARRLVVHGFFAEIIRRIGVADVEAALLAAVERELAVTAADHPTSQEQ